MRDIKFRAFKNEMMSKPFVLGEGVSWPNGSVSTANKIGFVCNTPASRIKTA